MDSLGETIKDRRLGKGWSKRALAEKAGISHSEVHRIETGERTNPSVPVLNALAEALGIPKDDLLLAAGYKSDDGDIPMIERVFPDLKTEKQQQTAQKIIDGLARSSDMDDSDYDRLVEQMEMFFNYVKKKDDTK
ncbi:HTH-type transcriptional repressor RghR [Desulfosporosinus acididurans]|uniref:HTH-type transcriptional repressor RghR n=1 Tax=Desulfosporosinus acididurans TaxID=476652 RepID=A0A0J1FLQ9_9FIRM|nr:helix-turn-helix domain-containing protein [Desulfosporosinus acididurans]KLU63878.1 HTH-type transcriptional repressor RghR [Desulfosporosinus acididurans]